MRVAGLGFRQAATASALRDALRRCGGHGALSALATAADKAESPALLALAGELKLRIVAVPDDLLRQQQVLTQSARVMALRGTGSLAEAAALAAAGAGARLLAPRVTSADGMATAAIAEVEAT